jgi:hypothetical protein
MSMRVIIEARENGGAHSVALDVDSKNWLDLAATERGTE